MSVTIVRHSTTDPHRGSISFADGHLTMFMNIRDNVRNSPFSNPKPLCDNFLFVKSGLGVDVLLGDVGDVIPVSHAQQHQLVEV